MPSGAAGRPAATCARAGRSRRGTAMDVFAEMKALVRAAIEALAAEGRLPQGLDLGAVTVEPPRDAAHGDMATNAAMVLARPARMGPRDIAEALAARARVGARCGLGRGGGAGLPEPAARSGALVRDGPGGTGGGRGFRALGARGGPAGQRRVRVGEPDGADACRPYPRRGVRRRAGRAARLRRLGRDAGILHQRRRGAGRRAGAVGLRALPRGLRAGAGDPRGALSGGLSDPGRRGAAGDLRR